MTPNLRYINQSAPFWDFVANLEDQTGEHPFFNRGNPDNSQSGPSNGFWPWQHPAMPRRGPPPYPGTPEQSREEKEDSPATVGDDEKRPADEDAEMREKDDAIPDPPEDTPENPGGPRGRRGHCGGRRGFGHRGHGHHGPHGRHHGPPPFAPWAHGAGFPFHHGGPGHGRRGPGGFGFLADMFNPQGQSDGSNDFAPEADIFDTEAAYIVHLSLPGAEKEDIGVSWDPEKSELLVAGVVHRPGDEEFLKTLALDERKVGAFERKIRLGTRASPAQVDVDDITARLENGILMVEVPKLHADFVEVRKVDIE